MPVPLNEAATETPVKTKPPPVNGAAATAPTPTITQEFVANIADVNTSHISNIENNRVKVSLPTLVQICNALDTTVDYILADEYASPQTALEQEILHEIQLCSYDTQKQILKIVKALQ